MGNSRWSWTVGSIAGIRIRIHASFVLLLLLVIMAGAASTVAGAFSELGWIATVFACVVVHELAHSVTATRLGIRVKDIVLFPLGGVSEMDRVPDDPRKEMAITGAGPAASLVLAGAALVTSAALGQDWWPPGLISGPLLARLGWLNALLGGFNLLPVLPMDGGRLLRASLEHRLGRSGSTIAAARVGRIGGAVFIAVGLFYNLWLAFIGVFILLGASMEGADAEVHERLSVVRVETAMMVWPWTIDANFRIEPPALEQTLARQGVLPVTAGARYIGTIGPAQRAAVAAVPGGAVAGEIADRGAPTVGPGEPLDHALDLLQRGGLSAVVVVDPEGCVRGVVTRDNLRQAVARTAAA